MPIERGLALRRLNLRADSAEVGARRHDLGLPPGKARVRDLPPFEDAGRYEGRFRATTGPHGVVTLRITPEHPRRRP